GRGLRPCRARHGRQFARPGRRDRHRGLHRQAQAGVGGRLMEPRVSIITVAVDDLDRMLAFYEAMGLARHKGITDGVAFYQLGGIIFALFGRSAAEEDSGIRFADGVSRIYLAYNVRSEAEVGEVLERAKTSGGRIVKPAQRAF